VSVRAAIPVVLTLFLTACDGVQSTLEPRGPHAAQIARLWWIMLAICSVVLVVVCGLVLAAVLRGRKQEDTEIVLSKSQKTRLVVTGGVAAPVVVVLGLLVYSVAISRGMTAEPANALKVEVVGHQWWWSIAYSGQEHANLNVTTANELHIPVGRPVAVELKSRDVIHSFWVPNLNGKTDVIPGRTNRTWIQADAPGTWRGQCAEYCGLQHAHMGFTVTAHSPQDFEQWLAQQREPAPEPTDAIALRGRDVFLGGPCAMCHTVRGTLALSRVGPDLTHVASRKTLASGTMPNTRGHLAGWILDPQAIKPGTIMPPNNLGNEDLHALLAYLETLK
jgi:cytochrome c oxidase subunit II